MHPAPSYFTRQIARDLISVATICPATPHLFRKSNVYVLNREFLHRKVIDMKLKR